MRILVGWDTPAEVQLIRDYLSVDGDDVTVTTTAHELLAAAENGVEWDIVLMTTADADGPDQPKRLDVFKGLTGALPDCPVVGACRNSDVFHIARFLTQGMRSYILRDAAGDYMFLLKVTLDNAVAAVRAEQDRILAAKLSTEVESVRKLQQSILPVNPKCPEGYSISAGYEPSQIRVFGGRAVTLAGGDYYDAFAVDDDSMVMLVGDASGHGMKACMSIMTMHTLVHMMREREFRDTATFVSEINRWLCDQALVNDEGGFITLLYGLLDPSREVFTWTSAGHPVPMLQNLETNEVTLLGSEQDGGLPLAIVPDAEYEIRTSKIPPRSRLLIFSDGLEEAFNEINDEHRQFGVDGITRVMKETRELDLPAAVSALFDRSSEFTEGLGRHDDTTVIMLERA